MNLFYEKKIPIYRGMLVIIISDDITELKKLDPDFPYEDIYAHATHRDWNDNEGYIVILNPNNTRRGLTYGVVAHEALHLVHYLFDNREMPYTIENDEHACYILEWIVDEIMKVLSMHGYVVSSS